MARVAKAKRAAASSTGWKWWQGMLGGMLLMLSPGAAMLLLALSAPALLVLVADNTQKRVLTRTVILFSIAGSIEPLRVFVTTGHDIGTAFDILLRPTTLLFAWLCAGSGWLLNEMSCLAATFIAGMRLAARRNSLEALLLEIRTEWELPEDPAPSS